MTNESSIIKVWRRGPHIISMPKIALMYIVGIGLGVYGIGEIVYGLSFFWKIMGIIFVLFFVLIIYVFTRLLVDRILPIFSLTKDNLYWYTFFGIKRSYPRSQIVSAVWFTYVPNNGAPPFPFLAFLNNEKVIVTKNIAETITEDFNPLFTELNLHPQGDREERLSPDQAAQRYPGVVPGPRLILLGWIIAVVFVTALIVLYILYKIHSLG